jgi:hypothetical protein|tara:strand:+ start:33 stop:272 length:240 start_codon:yes stop_codon:yes gene_type:complete
MEFITNTGETVEVEYTYDPGEPDQWYDSNGDPGTPGYGPSADIKHVWYTNTDVNGNQVTVDVQHLLEEDIEEKILERHE